MEIRTLEEEVLVTNIKHYKELITEGRVLRRIRMRIWVFQLIGQNENFFNYIM